MQGSQNAPFLKGRPLYGASAPFCPFFAPFFSECPFFPAKSENNEPQNTFLVFSCQDHHIETIRAQRREMCKLYWHYMLKSKETTF